MDLTAPFRRRTSYTLALICSARALSSSISSFCIGQPMPRPSVSFGLGI